MRLVANEPVEVQDFKKFTDRFRKDLHNIPQTNKAKLEDVTVYETGRTWKLYDLDRLC